jgi:leader peptidase (prepilin peptidase)/N-methyltransferase
MIASRKNKGSQSEESGQIPFGPFLAVAAPFMCLWGNDLLNLYVKYILE